MAALEDGEKSRFSAIVVVEARLKGVDERTGNDEEIREYNLWL